MSNPDVTIQRMTGDAKRSSVADVLALLDARSTALRRERITLLEAAGRVLAEEIVSQISVPAFARSAMDGFAVRASDTTGAAPDKPCSLQFVGESLPARPYPKYVQPGQAVRITTGAPIPDGADAVLMAEYAEFQSDGQVLACIALVPGKHVVRIGEDVASGTLLLAVGRRLRPQDIGILAAIGSASVQVVRHPRVAIIATGDELLAPGSIPTGTRIVDCNSPMLSALAIRDGAMLLPVRRVRDDYSAIRAAIRDAAADADVILVCGGTSAGAEDYAACVARELGELAVHGVAIRPGGPMGVAFLPNAEPSPTALFLLPGNPVACLCTYDLFAGRVIRRLGGRGSDLPYRSRMLQMGESVSSAAGRVDYLRVKVFAEKVRPLQGGAGKLSTTVAADGFILVPHDRDSLALGEDVEVWLYDAM